MKTFQQLYLDILRRETGEESTLLEEYNPHHMDCLLHPQNYALVVFQEQCEQCAS